MQSSGNNVQRAWTYLEERFGVSPDIPALQGLALREVSGDIWITTTDADTAMDVETYGIRFIRVQDIGLKPTTYALQILDKHIEKNRVELSRSDFVSLLEGDHVTVWDAEGLTKGYVAIEYMGRVMGCGMYQNSIISSRIPKGRAQELQQFL